MTLIDTPETTPTSVWVWTPLAEIKAGDVILNSDHQHEFVESVETAMGMVQVFLTNGLSYMNDAGKKLRIFTKRDA